MVGSPAGRNRPRGRVNEALVVVASLGAAGLAGGGVGAAESGWGRLPWRLGRGSAEWSAGSSLPVSSGRGGKSAIVPSACTPWGRVRLGMAGMLGAAIADAVVAAGRVSLGTESGGGACSSRLDAVGREPTSAVITTRRSRTTAF